MLGVAAVPVVGPAPVGALEVHIAAVPGDEASPVGPGDWHALGLANGWQFRPAAALRHIELALYGEGILLAPGELPSAST